MTPFILQDLSFYLSFVIMKKILILSIWAIITPVALLLSLFTLVYSANTINNKTLASLQNSTDTSPAYQLYTTIPDVLGIYTAEVQTKQDGIEKLIERFLDRYESPMEPHDTIAKIIVSTCKKLDLPPKCPQILTAIAMCESNLGNKTPEDSFNPLGFGIHSQGTLRFESWEEAFQKAAKGLKKYQGKGIQIDNLEELQKTYCPLSNGSWARCVDKFMKQLR
jgi:hypothetical protein